MKSRIMFLIIGLGLVCPAPLDLVARNASAAEPGVAAQSLVGGVAELAPPPPADDFCGDIVLSHHDGTAEGAYAWVLSGVSAPDYGAFAECFEGRFRICEVQFYLSQVGHQSGQTMDVFVWEDAGTGAPGSVVAMVPGVDPGLVAEWPQTSRHDVEMSVLVDDDWWVGYWGDWSGEVEGWFLAADEDGPGGCPRTNIAPGIGYPTGWEDPGIVSSWQDCKSLGIQVQGRDPVPTSTPFSSAPFPDGGVGVDQRSGGCADPTILANHDGTVENAYTWLQSAVAPPDFGAFAECFEGNYSICELQFFFAQIGGYSGNTMDVYVWEDSGVGSPGPVLAMVPGIDPGVIASWPAISQHNVSLPLDVDGRWWTGYWGDWPGEDAGWFIAADETGSGGCSRTRIAPGIGYPTGWEDPATISSWSDCRSLAMQVVVDGVPSSVEERASSISQPMVSPNPFRGVTEIEFRLTRDEQVEVEVYDALGRRIRRLAAGPHPAGSHRLVWDGRGPGGRRVADGAYFLRIHTQDQVETKRIVLMH